MSYVGFRLGYDIKIKKFVEISSTKFSEYKRLGWAMNLPLQLN